MEAYKVVRCPGSHIFWKTGSQTAVRLSVSNAGRALPPGTFLALIYVRCRLDSMVIVRLEDLGKLKKSSCIMRNGILDLPVCSTVPQESKLSLGTHSLLP
jgi:hypothetical protein